MGGFNSELGPSDERRSRKGRAQRRRLCNGSPLGAESTFSNPDPGSRIRPITSSIYLRTGSAYLSVVAETAGKRSSRHVRIESSSINEMAIFQRFELEQEERDDVAAASSRKGKFHSMVFRSKCPAEEQRSPDSGIDKSNGIRGSHTVNGLSSETCGLRSDLGMKA